MVEAIRRRHGSVPSSPPRTSARRAPRSRHRCRQQPDLPGLHFLALRVKPTRAPKTDEDLHPPFTAQGERLSPLHVVQLEILAADQLLTLGALPRVSRLRESGGPDRLHRTARPVDARQRLANVHVRDLPCASLRFQSNRRNVASLVCWTSAMSTPPPTAWTVPARRKTQSPGRGAKLCRHSTTLPVSSAARSFFSSTPGRRPA